MRLLLHLLAPWCLLFACATAVADDAADPAGIEFFEKKIRPLLVEHCHKCHGDVKEPKGSLRLDSRAGLMKGGDRGPALVAGDPDKSSLVQAVRYTDNDLRMPPKGKLADEQIADLAAWVKRGAPMPADPAPNSAAQPQKEFNLAERRKHWCYQPLAAVAPPEVKNKAWVKAPIDAFILEKLEAAGLQPAPPADPRTLLRRAYFDLIGLPPTPEEVAEFEQSAIRNPQSAFSDVVEKLLASPHYGERWGRHWLDLVRFAETLGHEFDYEIHNAWRYRDYVIRAFNADVPYDQFVLEHIAGDLLRADPLGIHIERLPRRHPTEGWNESIIGTGWFWFGEGKHSPVDIRQEQLNKIDNQIDVFGKTFLGQTIACARCHDHKFDAISQKDYYALARIFKGTRYQQAAIDDPINSNRQTELLGKIMSNLLEHLRRPESPWSKEVGNVEKYLRAAGSVGRESGATIDSIAARESLDSERLKRWIAALGEKDSQQIDHPLYAWTQLARETRDADSLERFRVTLLTELNARNQRAEETIRNGKESSELVELLQLGEPFSDPPPEALHWYEHGAAFDSYEYGMVVGSDASMPVERTFHTTKLCTRGDIRREGAVRSSSFDLDHRYLHFRALGKFSRVNLVVDGFNLIRDPIYGPLSFDIDSPQYRWHTIDVAMWAGHRAYLEIIDSSVADLTKSRPAETQNGYFAVQQIWFSNSAAPPPAPVHPVNFSVLRTGPLRSLADVAARYQASLASSPIVSEDFSREHLPASDLMDWLLIHKLLLVETPDPQVADLLQDYRSVQSATKSPTYVPAAAEGTEEEEHLLLRGNYRTPGELVPPVLADVFGHDRETTTESWPRRDLAVILTFEPLTARVMVNRIWQHHFGQGIVRTPDDFGRMGQPPTHPELLDYLAAKFIRRGWSIKEMHRLMLNSSAYQMASIADCGLRIADSQQSETPSSNPQSAIRNPQLTDPENRLLHRQNIQRLEAEIIRDNLLAVSGRLDRKQFGPSVLPHLTPFMEGRGRPGSSGPLDGDGRRSIYINVRRNFLTPMFLAFDYPIPFTTIGRRTSSNVPAQALSLMNGPLVLQESQRWAKAVLAEPNLMPPERIERMYLTAFARKPTAEESDTAAAFVAEQAKRYGGAADDPRAWADLCHVLVNVKEFIFVE